MPAQFMTKTEHYRLVDACLAKMRATGLTTSEAAFALGRTNNQIRGALSTTTRRSPAILLEIAAWLGLR